MFDFSKFTQGDWLEFAGIICSLFVGIVSLFIALKTLRQNSKMIEESTRPYIMIYSKTTYVQDTEFYIVIKNMGQSGAIIENVACDIKLEDYIYLSSINPFDKISNTFLAPNQSIYFQLDAVKLKKYNIKQINFEIEYHTGKRTYNEKCPINFELVSSIKHIRANTENKEMRGIYFALQELIEENL